MVKASVQFYPIRNGKLSSKPRVLGNVEADFMTYDERPAEKSYNYSMALSEADKAFGPYATPPLFAYSYELVAPSELAERGLDPADFAGHSDDDSRVLLKVTRNPHHSFSRWTTYRPTGILKVQALPQ